MVVILVPEWMYLRVQNHLQQASPSSLVSMQHAQEARWRNDLQHVSVVMESHGTAGTLYMRAA